MRKIISTLILLTIYLVACTPAPLLLENGLLGTWQDSEGFQIEFRSGGVGFIPGVEGKIPDTTFTYQIIDKKHVLIDSSGQQVTIELFVDDDKLIWKDTIGEVQYSRVKK